MQNVNIGTPPAVTTKTVLTDKFKGVDLTSGTVNVDTRRSPDAPNMMPGADGFPVKRPGYTTLLTLGGAMHGAYTLAVAGEEHHLLHAGTKLWELRAAEEGDANSDTMMTQGEWTALLLTSEMADADSCAAQLGGKLWILDGSTYRYYDGETLAAASSIATVPKITIAKSPNGKNGATSYLPVNLLTGTRTDSYLGEASTKDYYLSFDSLTDDAVTAQKLDAQGNWVDLAETTDFTVNRELGKVTFTTAPGASPVAGEDNVTITYTVESREDVVNKLRFSILYGVSGALDRVFMSGSPDEPNVDYWSEWNDPAYIGDTNYGQIGQESSPIVGYSVLNNYLVTHKQNEENGRNAFVRSGELDDDGFAIFKIVNVVQGDGACSTRSFASLNSEPMFLTSRGVYALTPSDITGERYAQCRSFYINGALKRLNAQQRQVADAVTWGRFYVLAAGGRLYLLDGDQKTYEAKSPYSAHQYECYVWNVDATKLWVQDDALWCGDADGNVRRFNEGKFSAEYSDDGAAIEAYWTTPLSNLGTWSNKKTVTGVWVVCQPYARSGAAVYYATDKDEDKFTVLKDVDIFSFDDVDFDRFTFNTLDRPAIIYTRRKAKKVKLFSVKIKNDRVDEPFGLLGVQINYKIGGKVK